MHVNKGYAWACVYTQQYYSLDIVMQTILTIIVVTLHKS